MSIRTELLRMDIEHSIAEARRHGGTVQVLVVHPSDAEDLPTQIMGVKIDRRPDCPRGRMYTGMRKDFALMDIPATFEDLCTQMRKLGVGRFRFTEVSQGGTVVEREVQLVGAVGPGAFDEQGKAKADQRDPEPPGPSPADLVLNPPRLDMTASED